MSFISSFHFIKTNISPKMFYGSILKRFMNALLKLAALSYESCVLIPAIGASHLSQSYPSLRHILKFESESAKVKMQKWKCKSVKVKVWKLCSNPSYWRLSSLPIISQPPAYFKVWKWKWMCECERVKVKVQKLKCKSESSKVWKWK